jgi:hypothetical protein
MTCSYQDEMGPLPISAPTRKSDMNIAKITNRVALVTVVLMIYWVFIFISTQVFGFRIFREHITDLFGMSILGIFAILAGAVILNIMYNLSAIADARAAEKTVTRSFNDKTILIAALASFVFLFGALYIGDALNSRRQETRLVEAANSLVKERIDVITKIADYNFSRSYVQSIEKSLLLLEKIDEAFPQVTAILIDEIDGKRILMGFSGRSYQLNDELDRVKFVLSTSADERAYLYEVFEGKSMNHRFTSKNGRYEIYVPVQTAKGMVVLHLSEWARYGKYSS